VLRIKKITAVVLSASTVVFILTGWMLHNAVSQDSVIKPAVYERGKPAVLLINSYHKGLSWTDDITDAVENKLDSYAQCELYIEYLDAKRLPGEMLEREFYNLLLKRYNKIRFRTVIVSDNNALSFAKKYRKSLFPDTPVIFCGINNFNANLIDASGWFTGVVEKTDASATFKIMKKINPKLRSCIVIGDNTPTGDAEIYAAREVLGNEADGVKIIYWVNLSTEVMLKRLKELNRNDDAVLLTVFNRDSNERYFDYEESSLLIAANTDAPVYGLWDFYLGKGVVGGHVANARDQGLAAAEMTLRIINGEDHSKIMIKRESPNITLFDYAALKKFNISKAQLPQGSIIRNTPHSLIRDNAGIISAALLLIITEGAALLFLFTIFMKSRKKALKDLEESEEKYRVLVDYSFDIIYKVNSDRIITFASPSWTVLLGHDISEVIGRLYTDFVHPDDVKACEESIMKILSSSERQSDVEYRVRHIDGSWRLHTSSAVPIIDESGKFTSFVGIAKDITDRKNAEMEVKKLLSEKELLLKEVHHRIKNNMGTISGLLYLQKDTVKNEEASNALRDARSRVQSMMVIYDKLYRSDDFRSISANDYLSNLVKEVSSTFAGDLNVGIDLKIEDLILDSDILFPVGIIINELLSNTYKYAFPGRKNGNIRIFFARKSDRLIEIVFHDNGIGLPDDVISGKSAGFGMNLVKLLIKQINGNLQVARNDGTEYIISFPS
jgi:PAS domain S-box-containing protein